MAKQVQEAYIVAATRTPIGRSHRGFFRNMRPDDLLATTLKAALAAAQNAAALAAPVIVPALPAASAASAPAPAQPAASAATVAASGA